MSEHEAMQRRVAASRIRKVLYWTQIRGQTLEPAAMQVFCVSGLWRELGYQRLQDCLEKEFRIGGKQCVDLVVGAIKSGAEDANLYHIADENENDGRPSEPVGATRPGVPGRDGESPDGCEGLGDRGPAAPGG